MPQVWILTNGSDKQLGSYKSAVDIYTELQQVIGSEVALIQEEDLFQRTSTEKGLGLYLGEDELEIPKIVFIRISSEFLDPNFTHGLVTHLESMGVLVMNNSKAISTATNKALTYQILSKHGNTYHYFHNQTIIISSGAYPRVDHILSV